MDFSILGLMNTPTNYRASGCGITVWRLRAKLPAMALAVWMAVFPFGSLLEARPNTGQESQAPSEAQIKAAFLLNFARFAEWSSASLPDASPVVIFCFDGAEDVRIAFEALTNGKDIMGRKIVNRKLSVPANAQSCHAVYANDSKNSREVELLKTARDGGALTVGDGPTFLNCGGMIQLVVDENRIRFDINMNPVNGAKLKLSSKLLALARHVVDYPWGSSH
jgi:hypothetical protein